MQLKIFFIIFVFSFFLVATPHTLKSLNQNFEKKKFLLIDFPSICVIFSVNAKAHELLLGKNYYSYNSFRKSITINLGHFSGSVRLVRNWLTV